MRRLLATLSLTAALTAGPALVAEAAPAGILSGDKTDQPCEHVDPIVSPGERSAHGHMFFGAGPVSTLETSDHLRGQGQTTWDVRSNFTAVWIPCVFEDGRLLQQFSRHGILAYYRSVSGTECAFPDDLGSVSHRYGYRGQIGGGSFSLQPPASSRDGSLVIFIDFNLAARATNWEPCFANIRVFIRLNVGAGPIGNITLGGPVVGVDGAMPADHMHGDYFAAHGEAWFQSFLEECLRPGRACGRNPQF